jgi:hypothetical protein
MSNPYRDCLVELYAWAKCTSSHYYRTADVLDRTRILLAQPEPAELTEQEIDGLFEDHCSYFDEGRPALARWDFHEAVQVAIAADRARRSTPQPLPDGEVGG